jgi:hypothetical protein
MTKKILKIAGISLMALLGIALAAPFLFKNKILAFAKKELNKQLNAKADFSTVNISFFRHFPNAAIALENLTIIGNGAFAADTLISAQEIDVAVNISSLIRGSSYEIQSITIQQPRIHAIVTKEGKTNWDIAKPDSTPATNKEEKPFQLKLNKYEIKDGYISYKDVPSNLNAEIIQLQHEGSGDFAADFFTLASKTSAAAVTFNYGGIAYLSNTKTDVEADVYVDSKNNKYSFQNGVIKLNELLLNTDGFFQLINDSTYAMDIKYKAPSTNFKSILSLIPIVYQQNFATVTTTGKALFSGFVKGTYSAQLMPAYQLLLEIKDGYFKYPDLPKPVQQINLSMKINNPDGITDHTVVEIPQAHIVFGQDPFDVHFIFKNPTTTKFIDGGAKGKLDLAQLSQFIKLPDGTKIAGLLNADITAKGNLSALQQAPPGNFSGKGYIDISNLYYASKNFPQPVQNTHAKIIIESPDGIPNNTTIAIPAAHVEVGTDAADITLLLKNPITDPYFDGTAKGNFDLSKVKQFYTFPSGTTLGGLINANLAFKGQKSMIDKKQYDAIQTTGSINASNINYQSKEYPDGLQIKTANVSIAPKTITVAGLAGSFLKTNFSGSGSFTNAIGYALHDEPLAGTLTVAADNIDLNQWMGNSSTAATTNTTPPENSKPFAVPKNLNIVLNTQVGNVLYDKVNYKNINGALLLSNEAVALKNVRTEALDGTMAINGSYSTLTSKTNPTITLTYDVKNLNVQKTFAAFNTIQKLAPIAQFIDGKLSSQLTMMGKLNEGMLPQLNSLTGNGNMFLIEGLLKKFAPLEKLAALVDIPYLDNISVKDVKNYITFANGKVAVKPFTLTIKDIEMEVGGMHGFDMSIDYIINLKIPRALMGAKGNALVNNLVAQVNSKGVPMQLSDKVTLQVKMGGTIKDPILSTNLKQSATSLAQELKQQTTDLVKQKVDSAKTTVTTAVKDTLANVKKQVVKDLGAELKKKLFSSTDSAAAKDSTSGTKDTKKKIEESAKGLLENINPFKKKKKENDTVPN